MKNMDNLYLLTLILLILLKTNKIHIKKHKKTYIIDLSLTKNHSVIQCIISNKHFQTQIKIFMINF